MRPHSKFQLPKLMHTRVRVTFSQSLVWTTVAVACVIRRVSVVLLHMPAAHSSAGQCTTDRPAQSDLQESFNAKHHGQAFLWDAPMLAIGDWQLKCFVG